jgi:hypothetical protein
MTKIYYAIKPKFSNVTRYASEKDYQRVYDLVFQITGNHNDSANAQGWCELASLGETYTTNLFTIEIIED